MSLYRTAGNSTATLAVTSGEHLENDGFVSCDTFQRMICLERKRTERSRKPFLLMLLDTGDNRESQRKKALNNISSALIASTRETDIKGWYRTDHVIGVMFIEIALSDRNLIVSTMLKRITDVLRRALSSEQFSRLAISCHLFPEDWDRSTLEGTRNPTLYPDLAKRDASKRGRAFLKRAVDLIGSSMALVAGSPLFVLIAVVIKLTSKGPVLFRQTRIGQHGIPFTFLKFRSMYVNNSSDAHEEYVRKLIAGQDGAQTGDSVGSPVYKMTEDSRVTVIGRILRRTSLDELPQFVNVFRGEMSLVGPRPAIRYEVDAYDIWHRARLLEAKPGITGLWQVNGRSRVKFDEMVRLDLQYARTWSPWLDIKILLQTPKAVVLGEGAY